MHGGICEIGLLFDIVISIAIIELYGFVILHMKHVKNKMKIQISQKLLFEYG